MWYEKLGSNSDWRVVMANFVCMWIEVLFAIRNYCFCFFKKIQNFYECWFDINYGSFDDVWYFAKWQNLPLFVISTSFFFFFLLFGKRFLNDQIAWKERRRRHCACQVYKIEEIGEYSSMKALHHVHVHHFGFLSEIENVRGRRSVNMLRLLTPKR